MTNRDHTVKHSAQYFKVMPTRPPKHLDLFVFHLVLYLKLTLRYQVCSLDVILLIEAIK